VGSASQVARFVAIHEEILRMPMGYETLVGDMGSSLSGGQMQRVVLARSIQAAHSAVRRGNQPSGRGDNERAINEAIRRLPISRVIMAHRRSTLEMSDRIVPIWPTVGQIGRAQCNISAVYIREKSASQRALRVPAPPQASR
jgi:ATP-binding cassette subfamily B protein RaxB